MLKKQLKLPLTQFDQPFHPVILCENCLIRIVININKTSKIAIGLVVSEAPCYVLEQDTFTPKKVLIIPR